MKLSIIIPVYNSEKYINNCLESLLAQEMLANEYEIIIVNDGSTDSSGLIVRNYTENILIFIYLIKKIKEWELHEIGE